MVYKYKVYKIIKVLDGDTVRAVIDCGFDIYHYTTVRLNGINTPESRTSDLHEKELGLKAKQFTIDFLVGDNITVRSDKKEKFGRYLGDFMVDGKSLAKALLKNKLAKEYHGEKRGKWTDIA